MCRWARSKKRPLAFSFKAIEEMLNKYEPINPAHEVAWPAYEASAAKPKKSFELDYIMFRLESTQKIHITTGKLKELMLGHNQAN